VRSIFNALLLLLLSTVAACDAPEPELVAETQQAELEETEYFGACEDECSECGDFHRCASETRYYCAPYAHGCGTGDDLGARPLACMCCGKTECLQYGGLGGTYYCQACPEGQVCDDSSNECCVPSCGSAVCGSLPDDGCGYTIDCGTCSSGQTCVAGACCLSACPAPSVGSPCGSIPNGCGGTISCPGCGIGRVCAGGVCACKPGYKDCGDRCVPQNNECP
jgi:hypothetical protein